MRGYIIYIVHLIIINVKFDKCRKSGDLAPRILNLGSTWR